VFEAAKIQLFSIQNTHFEKKIKKILFILHYSLFIF